MVAIIQADGVLVSDYRVSFRFDVVGGFCFPSSLNISSFDWND